LRLHPEQGNRDEPIPLGSPKGTLANAFERLGPEVSAFFRPDYGILSISADTGVRNLDRVRDLIRQVIDQIGRNPLTREDVERTKRKMLLQWVQGYETNAGMANFYAGNLYDFERFGRFRNYEEEIEAVTAADVNRVAAAYLRSDRRVDIRGDPTLTYTQFYAAMGISFLLAVMIGVFLIWKKARRRIRRMPLYLRKR
jgi:hypothetical protein